MNYTAVFKSNYLVERLIRRTPGIYGGFARLLDRFDTYDLDQRRKIASGLLEKALNAAQETGYARKLSLDGDYGNWPILDKDALRDNPGALAKRQILPAAQASTGGTTGIPLALRRSWTSVVFEQAVLDHLCRAGGVDLSRARVAVLRGDNIKDPSDLAPPFWVERHGGRHLAMSANHLGAGTVAAYQETLNRFDPELLWVYPTVLEAFCRLADKQALRLKSLKLVLASSEVLPAEINALAGDVLGAPVCDYYGQAERVCASYAFKSEEHYFLPASGHVELAFSHEDEAGDYYEVIGTPYWNRAQPLVRYRTGDFARLPKGLSAADVEAVAFGILPFLGIVGRATDYTVSIDGTHLVGMDHIPRGIPHVAQMQIHQYAPERIEIHVVPLPGYGAAVEAMILDQARQKIPETTEVAIRTVDRLQRTARGKAPLVVRHFDERPA